MRLLATLFAIAVLGGCGRDAGVYPVTGPQTQIVVQWMLPQSVDAGRLATLSRLFACYRAEGLLERRGGSTYFMDGHDVGSGTFNVFLYSQQTEATLSKVVELDRAGKLPKGTRIGVAQYKDEARTDWVFKPVYPQGLARFDIVYPSTRASS